MQNQTHPRDYLDVISLPSEPVQIGFANYKPIIVGGQATNLWAEIYRPSLPKLSAFEPFVSIDADILGGINAAAAISKRTGWQLIPMDDPDSIIAGMLKKTRPHDGLILQVDVLREVPGVTDAELEGFAKTVEIQPNTFCCIPSPPVLLKAKIHNLHEVPQQRSDGTPRNDMHHVRMLMHICPHYIQHMAQNAATGVMSDQRVLTEIFYLHEVVSSPAAVKLKATHQLDLKNEIFQKLSPQSVPQMKPFLESQKNISMAPKQTP
jgi:hypothetical protein